MTFQAVIDQQKVGSVCSPDSASTPHPKGEPFVEIARPWGVLACLRKAGAGAWALGGEGIDAGIRGAMEGLRLHRGVAAARIGSAEIRMDLSHWRRLDVAILRNPAMGPVCRVEIGDGQGRRVLELRKAGDGALRLADDLRRRILSTPAPEPFHDPRVEPRRVRFDAGSWREHWDHRVRSVDDLDELFQWHGLDRPAGLDLAGAGRAARLGAWGLEAALVRLSGRRLHARIEVGTPGARIADRIPLEGFLFAAGRLILPGPGFHLSLRRMALEGAWAVRLQGVAGASFHLEIHDASKRGILKLEEDACPLLAKHGQQWREGLESCFQESPDRGPCITAAKLDIGKA